MLRLDSETGETLWEQDIAPASGTTLRGFEIAADASNHTVVHIRATTTDGSASLRLVGRDTGTGNQLWNLAHCESGALIAYQRSANDLRMRMLADSTVEYVQSCLDGSDRKVELGRIHAATGNPVWQRTLEASSIYRGMIDASGSFLLEGPLVIDGAELGLARLDSSDAHLLWSLPAPADPPGVPPYITNRYVVTGPYLHVLEMSVVSFDYVNSAMLTTYALGSGEFLRRIDANFPADQLVVPRTASIDAFGNGEVRITALSGRNRYVGSRLFETRLNGLTGYVGWSRQTPVMSPMAFIPQSGPANDQVMIWNSKLRPGLILAGSGLNGNNYTYPRVAKVNAQDGQISWRWQPDSGINGSVSAAMSDAQGDVIIVGSNGWNEPSLLLTKLDGATGELLWVNSTTTGRGAFDGALDDQGNILVLLDRDESDPESRLRLSKRSTAKGDEIWSTDIPESLIVLPGEVHVLASPNDSDYVLAPWWTDSSTFGTQLTRLRNSDGSIVWRRKLPGLPTESGAQIRASVDGDVIVSAGRLVWRIDGVTGEIKWHVTLPLASSFMVVDEQGQLVFGGSLSSHRAVARIDSSTGTTLWMRELAPFGSTGLYESIDVVSIGTDGNILAAGNGGPQLQVVMKFDLLDGETIWETVSASPAHPKVAKVKSLGGTRDPFGILQAPDGNIYSSAVRQAIPAGSSFQELPTWTVTKITGPFADGIFGNGFDG